MENVQVKAIMAAILAAAYVPQGVYDEEAVAREADELFQATLKAHLDRVG